MTKIIALWREIQISIGLLLMLYLATRASQVMIGVALVAMPALLRILILRR